MISRRREFGRGLLLATALLLTIGISGCGDRFGPMVQGPVTPPPTRRPTLYEVRRGPPPNQVLVAAVFVTGEPPANGQECCSAALMPIVESDDWIAVGESPPMDWCAEYGPQLPEPFVAEWFIDPNNIENALPCSQGPTPLRKRSLK